MVYKAIELVSFQAAKSMVKNTINADNEPAATPNSKNKRGNTAAPYGYLIIIII